RLRGRAFRAGRGTGITASDGDFALLSWLTKTLGEALPARPLAARPPRPTDDRAPMRVKTCTRFTPPAMMPRLAAASTAAIISLPLLIHVAIMIITHHHHHHDPLS